ncbi:MAG: hypothetical protein IJ733_17665 [Lachnospiraceae bacterium]|nr:hypothetical protein [Lachnospiraceae bacterium]
MHVSLAGKKNRYEFELAGKYSILTGNSADRKTEFLKTMIRYKNGVRSVSCNISLGSYKIRKENIFVYSNDVSAIDSYRSAMLKHTDCLFIIDESSDIFRDREVAAVFQASKNYYIIISREIMGWLPISIDSIYTLVNQNGVLVNVPKYCENNEDLTKIKKADYILTEDSKSSRAFFQYHFQCDVCDRYYTKENIRHTMDNSCLHSALMEEMEKHRHILVAFDASAYGYFYELLLKVIGSRDVSILAWNSYENYLLRCPKFGIHLNKDDAGCAYNSLEELSYHRLREILSGYSISGLHSVLKDSSFVQYPLTLI